MVVLYIASILLTIVLTAYITLKAVQLGLRWQIETKKDSIPTMPTIISEQLEKKEIKQQEAKQLNILNEWFGGADQQ